MFLGGKQIAWHDRQYKASTRSAGYMLYATRHVIETVGGMRTEYPRWGGEHTEWSRRIRNAGFTPRPYMDVLHSERLLYGADQHGAVESTTGLPERESTRAYRHELHARFRGSSDYIDYRSHTIDPAASIHVDA
jgi:hypothetical protein